MIWWPRVVVLLAAILLVVGALTVLPPLSSQAGAYLANRNIGLAILLIALLFARCNRSLGVVLPATAGMHAGRRRR